MDWDDVADFVEAVSKIGFNLLSVLNIHNYIQCFSGQRNRHKFTSHDTVAITREWAWNSSNYKRMGMNLITKWFEFHGNDLIIIWELLHLLTFISTWAFCDHVKTWINIIPIWAVHSSHLGLGPWHCTAVLPTTGTITLIHRPFYYCLTSINVQHLLITNRNPLAVCTCRKWLHLSAQQCLVISVPLSN